MSGGLCCKTILSVRRRNFDSRTQLAGRPPTANNSQPGHGSDTDSSRFWGEAQGEMLEAMHVGNVPNPCHAVVFSGCCWGALTVRVRALLQRDGDPVQPVTPEQSIALSFLAAGARAFVGCTGAHYSPLGGDDLNYFGSPMHQHFWTHLVNGKEPAEALFRSKIDYIAGMPHGRSKIEETADPLAGWEPVKSPAAQVGDASDRPLSTPDRVARERSVIVEKYLGDADEATLSGPVDNTHSTLTRMKKKNAFDNDVNAKTFVKSDGKIIGSQG